MWKQTVIVPAYKAKITIEIDKPEDEITGIELLNMISGVATQLAVEHESRGEGVAGNGRGRGTIEDDPFDVPPDEAAAAIKARGDEFIRELQKLAKKFDVDDDEE